jgi:hypothetical protein
MQATGTTLARYLPMFQVCAATPSGSGRGRPGTGAPPGPGHHPSPAKAETASQWEQAAAALVDAAVPPDAQLPAVWPTCAELLPHARTVLDLTSSGMEQIAQYLRFSGSYPAARDLFRLITGA